MIVDPQFRLEAYKEAKRCMQLVDKLDIREPEFWANLFGAIVNTNIACIPDSVASGLMQASAAQQKAHQHLKKALDEAQKK